MILVTGGAGFIGSNVVHGLNARGHRDILVVDDLEQGDKFRNLVDARISDYIDKDDFARMLERDDPSLRRIEAVLHQGACSDTTVRDGRFMMKQNYESSKALLTFAQARRIPMIYASSAATYGGGDRFVEEPSCEAPLNVYGYSKLLFDQRVRDAIPMRTAPVVGLRYFNVYGPREQHKAKMASVAFHLHHQLLQTDRVRLFVGSGGYGDGEQRRDLVHVDDVVAVNLWFLDHPDHSGIYNVGTGAARPFNDVAKAVIGFHGRGALEYIPFPDTLVGRYQSYTQADLSALRRAGYTAPFTALEAGMSSYLRWLTDHP